MLTTPSRLWVRAAHPGDAEAIGRIRVAAWRAAYRGMVPDGYLEQMDPGANLAPLRVRLAEPTDDFRGLVAEAPPVASPGNAAVIGWALVGAPRYPAPGNERELWALFVDPAAWRQGAGRALVADVLGRVSASNTVGLWCLSANARALEFYDRLGFTRTDQERTTSELTGHPLHELLLRRPGAR